MTLSDYLLLAVIGLCVVPHLWMMFRGHGGRKNDEAKDEHKKDGCCH